MFVHLQAQFSNHNTHLPAVFFQPAPKFNSLRADGLPTIKQHNVTQGTPDGGVGQNWLWVTIRVEQIHVLHTYITTSTQQAEALGHLAFWQILNEICLMLDGPANKRRVLAALLPCCFLLLISKLSGLGKLIQFADSKFMSDLFQNGHPPGIQQIWPCASRPRTGESGEVADLGRARNDTQNGPPFCIFSLNFLLVPTICLNFEMLIYLVLAHIPRNPRIAIC